jgi:hypothetical protein
MLSLLASQKRKRITLMRVAKRLNFMFITSVYQDTNFVLLFALLYLSGYNAERITDAH